MMFSNLIAKARNLLVQIHLRSSDQQLAGKIIDIDEFFVEVIVKINSQSGQFASSAEEFHQQEGWVEDRILINISDISIIA